jgi:hypothetical protein
MNPCRGRVLPDRMQPGSGTTLPPLAAVCHFRRGGGNVREALTWALHHVAGFLPQCCSGPY